MGAKVKGQGHKVTIDGNAQSAISVIFHPTFRMFFETWLVYRQYLAQSPCELSGPYAKGQGHSETKQKMGANARTIHHSMLCYYFRHTTDFIGQNTRGRSPHASLDINTTSNNCPVSLSQVAQLVERQTPDSEVPGSNPTNTQLLFFFLSSFVEIIFNTTPKKGHLKKKKREKKP